VSDEMKELQDIFKRACGVMKKMLQKKEPSAAELNVALAEYLRTKREIRERFPDGDDGLRKKGESAPASRPAPLDPPRQRDDPDKRVRVKHTPRSAVYHDLRCSSVGTSAEEITLFKAKKQLNARPAKCCIGKDKS